MKVVDCVGCKRSMSRNLETLQVDVVESIINPMREEKKLFISCFLSDGDVSKLLEEFKSAKNQKIESVESSLNKPTIGHVYVYRTDDEVTGVDRTITPVDSSTQTTKSAEYDNSVLSNIIRNGPRPYEYKYDELAGILTKAKDIISKEPVLIECPIPCAVYGDIHGQYSDLFRWFQINGWPSKTKSVFLGDYVDYGIYGIEVIGLLCALKIEFPNNIYLIRGNHEEEQLNRSYQFYHEVLLKFGKKKGEQMFGIFGELFSYLPLSCLIGKKVLCMHGGLSPKLKSLDSLREIRRPIKIFMRNTLACDLVWSDPIANRRDPAYIPNCRRSPGSSIGQLFSIKAIEDTLKTLKIDLIVRGHQVPLKGINSYADGKCLTLFSAPGYQGDNAFNINWGASLNIDKDFHITINKLRVTRKCRMNRIKVVSARNKFVKNVFNT
uniref:Serine/threonine-protein phosphatase n=1 Tax=Strongyloides papillosus TaxID=174720 RepID=A0A0N5BCZ3_STREA